MKPKSKERYEQWRTSFKSLLQTTNDVVKQLDKSLFLKEQLVKERLETCDQCEYYQKQHDRCQKCGCNMKLKTKLYAAKCPIDKW